MSVEETLIDARADTTDWLVAATIATEVPPSPMQNSHSKVMFTSPMILAAQQAVAEVIANRMAHPGFPKTALGVILQPKQFSGVMRGVTAAQLGHRDIWADAVVGSWFPAHVQECWQAWRRVREMTRTGHDAQLVPGALYYYSPVSMVPPFRVPEWVNGKALVECERISTDYFRWFK